MIRFAEPSDQDAVRSLWEKCFPDEGGFNEYFFAHFFDIRRVLLSIAEDRLCAMIQQLTYIYGACTDPDCRRQGHMARLLEYSFELDRKNGVSASALIPAEKWLFDFYRPFGYLPFFKIARGMLYREKGGILPRRLTEADTASLQEIYESSTPACHIMRSEAYWQGQIRLFNTIGAGAFGWEESGKLAAYAFCWKDFAQEAIGLTDEREQGLLLALGCDALAYAACGGAEALGCIKWHKKTDCADGYMNLMLN